MGQFDSGFFAAANLIEQDGLSTGFTSGVTDFDAYIASNPTDNFAAGYWASTAGNTTGFLEFDLGGVFDIELMALWNYGGAQTHNIVTFNLIADLDGDFGTGAITLLSGQTANTNTGPLAAVLPEVFTFASTEAQFVQLQVLSNNGNTNFTQAQQVAFEAAASVPEPSHAVFIIVGLGAIMRRRK